LEEQLLERRAHLSSPVAQRDQELDLLLVNLAVGVQFGAEPRHLFLVDPAVGQDLYLQLLQVGHFQYLLHERGCGTQATPWAKPPSRPRRRAPVPRAGGGGRFAPVNARASPGARCPLWPGSLESAEERGRWRDGPARVGSRHKPPEARGRVSYRRRDMKV